MVRSLKDRFIKLVELTSPERDLKQKFLSRLAEGNLTRDENPFTHFCVYFAVYDPTEKRVFMGQHKKSGLWLFNGGHIDKGETPSEALEREIMEELGLEMRAQDVGSPELLTLTKIEHPERQICQWHYDIWYFISTDCKIFQPSIRNIHKEFHDIRWLYFEEALTLVGDPNTLSAIHLLSSSI